MSTQEQISEQPPRPIDRNEQKQFITAMRALASQNYVVEQLNVGVDIDNYTGDMIATTWSASTDTDPKQQFIPKKIYSVNTRTQTAAYHEEILSPIAHQPALGMMAIIMREANNRRAARELATQLGEDIFTAEKLSEIIALLEACAAQDSKR